MFFSLRFIFLYGLSARIKRVKIFAGEDLGPPAAGWDIQIIKIT